MDKTYGAAAAVAGALLVIGIGKSWTAGQARPAKGDAILQRVVLPGAAGLIATNRSRTCVPKAACPFHGCSDNVRPQEFRA